LIEETSSKARHENFSSLSSQKRMIPVIDISQDKNLSAKAIRSACEENGFFLISHHGISLELQHKLESLSHTFFALSESEKNKISMDLSGKAWRGYFPVGGELTSGKKDLKEGIYFGDEQISKGEPLHGPNLFPEIKDFKATVLTYMKEVTELGHHLMGLLSLSLDLPEDYFFKHYTQDPTLLFRIFHYPPMASQDAETYPWGVGAHTDYGILTMLKQDMVGGLEVQTKSGWMSVPPVANTFVCNIGDMLDFLTKGFYRSAPHRVRNTTQTERYSYPFFFDPGFHAIVRPLPLSAEFKPSRVTRWDNQDLYAYEGSYGDYLISKVSKVFPELAASKLT
jgi:isopenicillin N synthase-like dioxygenase